MLSAELQNRTQVEWITEGVCDHDGLGLAGYKGGCELLRTDITRSGVVIDKDCNGARLDDRGNGRWEACGDRYNLIAKLYSLVCGQLVGGKRRDRD